ncbi:MAG: hypothetical protein ACM336_05600 [Acidobacteriota bacterium]
MRLYNQAPMYENLLAENRPFPDSDIETIPTEALGLAPGCTAASYLRLETALARIAGPDAPGLDSLLNADPATSRYTVLTSVANGAAYSVIAAVARTLGARDQVRAALEPNVPPALITSAADIGPNRAIFFSLNAALKFERSPRIRFLFHWLREVAAGKIEGQIGTDVDSGIDASVRAVLSDRFLAAVALDAAGRLRLRLFRHRDSSLDASSTITVQTGFATPLEGRRDQLIATILEAGSGAPAEAAAAAALAGSVYDKALAALKTKFAAALSWSYSRASHGTAVGEGSFEFTAQGLADYRAALAGDFRGALTGEVIEALSGENCIELHLPFLDRKQWSSRWNALARARVEAGEDGRLVAYTVSASDTIRQNNTYQSTLALAGSLLYPQKTSSFEITYIDRRTGSGARFVSSMMPLLAAYSFPPDAGQWLAGTAGAGAEVETALTLSVPGTLASAWLRAPAENEPEFFPVYAKVSVAVQRAMRTWLPFVYFHDIGRYEDLLAALPLVFYQSTRPFYGRPKSEFAYDLISPECPGIAGAPLAIEQLSRELRKVAQALRATGRDRLAEYYAPWRAPEILAGIVRRPRLINALITGDALFIHGLVRLGLEARKLAGMLASDPMKATRKLVEFASDFAALFHRRLRRLYGGRDFAAFGTLLLVEATRAMGAALDGEAEISGTLRLKAGGRERMFVNSGYRPKAA